MKRPFVPVLGLVVMLGAVVAIAVASDDSHRTVRAGLSHEGDLVFSKRGSTFLARPDGSHARKVKRGDFEAVSPNGATLLTRAFGTYTDEYKEAAFSLVQVDGGSSHQITDFIDDDKLSLLGWSPDSQHVIICAGADVQSVDVSTYGSEKLANNAACQNGASVAPDGTRFVYATGTTLYIASFSDAGSKKQLTNEPIDGVPLWGPKSIAYQVTTTKRRKSGPSRSTTRVKIISADGGAPTTLDTHSEKRSFDPGVVQWSGDGRYLLTSRDECTHGDLLDCGHLKGLLIDVQTHHVQTLKPRYRGDNIDPQGISSDGRYVLAMERKPTFAARNGLVRIPVTGGRAQPLVNSSGCGYWADWPGRPVPC